MPDGGALVSKVNGSSAFNFSFTTAWFPAPAGSGAADGLVVRNVECNPNHHPCPQAVHPEWSNAGALAVVRANLSSIPPRAEYVGYESIQWPGTAPPPRSTVGKWGAADPRVTFRPETGLYYLTWDNCTQNCFPQRSTLLSTSADPFNASAWTLHGPVLPGKYTGGAALFFRDSPPHLAFVSDSDTANSILLATSTDGIHWQQPQNASKRVFMAGREECWDKAVAVGTQPLPLSSGDFVLFYNIDTGFPYHGNPLGRCAIGWAVVSRHDPTTIVARASEPLLIATLPWEQCPVKNYTCQETMVVFTTGAKPTKNDSFQLLFGGGDTDVGIVNVKVHIKTTQNGE